MQDFRDCLTHKLARVTIAEFQPGKFEEAQRLYQEAVDTYGEGFCGAYLLREQGSDRGISVILWDDEAAMAAHDTAVHQAILKQMAPLFASRPENREYEVVSEVVPSEVLAS
ncbi:antibiotic biosynthesis monooxygenase family protein [Alkalinema pantanalense CENA528]|uniref:antibiotic biosynthesis monooxygenase family protein n=1 Tax=Alkalinema pantanalense TaxID=1620705 RepID=UPI003D6FA860